MNALRCVPCRRHKDAMNQLDVSLQHSITTLAAHGWSHRRIARELDINRETVSKYLRLADSKPAISTPGSEADPAAKPAISTLGSTAGRQSLCLPWEPQIEAAVSVGLSAQRIYQDLVGDHGFTGSYQAVKRFVRHLRQTQPIPFVRIEVEPGMEAQVDFGQGAWVAVDGKRKRPHLFRVVLSHSRKGYSEVVWRQTTESFIRCLENSVRYYGSVPRTLITDNHRAAVTRADWYDPEINPKVEEFCRHYGTVIMPTRPGNAPPQRKSRSRCQVWPKQRTQGAVVHQFSGPKPVLVGLGAHGGRHAHSRHHPATSHQSVPRGGTGQTVAVAAEFVSGL